MPTSTKRPPRRAPKPIPWPDIRRAFVEGAINAEGQRIWPGPSELAERFPPLARETVSRRASAENWEGERALFRHRLKAETREAKADLLADDAPDPPRLSNPLLPRLPVPDPPPPDTAAVLAAAGARFDLVNLRIAEALQAEIERALKDAAVGATLEPPVVMGPRALQTLASALAGVQRVGRLALGDTTDNQGFSGGVGVNAKLDLGALTREERDALRPILERRAGRSDGGAA